MKDFFNMCLICFISLLFFSCQICTNEILKSDQLDGDKIILFSRDAGATTSASLQISIIPATKNLPNAKGNICITDGRFLDYKFNDSCIVITYTGNLFLRKEHYKDYLIRYEKK